MSLKKLFSTPKRRIADPSFEKVKLLLHMDGDDNGTVFTDVKGGTIVSTGVVTKTGVKKAGSASAYFAGGASSLRVNSPLVSAIGTGAFSLEMTFFPESLSQFGLYMNASPNNGGNEWGVYVYGGYLRFYIGRRGSSQFDIGVAKTFVAGQKYEINIERTEGGVWWFYINGVAYTPILLVANGGAWNPNTNIISDQPCYLGCFWPGANPYTGYLDEVRLTIGGARGYGQPLPMTDLPFPSA